MKSKEKMLELLSKFGMDLNYHDPFLYERDGKYGLVYTFSHPFYGLLTRVLFLESEEEMEEFLYQYWWYKKYGETYHVIMSLNNYEQLEVQPVFLFHGNEITSDDMKALLVDPLKEIHSSKKVKEYQRYLRTAHILIDILNLKVKFQQDTYKSVLDLELEFQKQENELIQLLNRYEKTNEPLKELELETSEKQDFEISDFQHQLEFLSEYENLDDLKTFIDSLWKMLLSYESDDGHLQNKYLLIKMPLELNDIRKKKDYLESLFNKKKGLFFKKEHVREHLVKIDEMSEVNKIVKMEDYIQNEKKRLNEKYSIIDEMDYTTLGDYLNEFDNMGIDVPFENSESSMNLELSHDDLIKEFTTSLSSLNVIERQCSFIYHSFLESICDEILLLLMDAQKEQEILAMLMQKYTDELTRALQVLSDPENVFIRMKKMKLLSLSNLRSFCMSLIEVCKTLLSMKGFMLSSICYVFGKSQKEAPIPKFYHASCKSSMSPTQVKGAYDIHDILEIHPGVSCYFFSSYYSLKDPYFHDDSLVEEQNREDILLFLKDYKVNFKKSDILKVARYKIDKNEKMVEEIRLLKTDFYRHVMITR